MQRGHSELEIFIIQNTIIHYYVNTVFFLGTLLYLDFVLADVHGNHVYTEFPA